MHNRLISHALFWTGTLCLIPGGFMLGAAIFAPIVMPSIMGERPAWFVAGVLLSILGWAIGSWRPHKVAG